MSGAATGNVMNDQNAKIKIVSWSLPLLGVLMKFKTTFNCHNGISTDPRCSSITF